VRKVHLHSDGHDIGSEKVRFTLLKRFVEW